MEESPCLKTRAPRFISTALTYLAMLCAATTVSAQTTIALTQLLAQGFTNGPSGYSLNVTGIRSGVSSALFQNINTDETGRVRAHGGTVRISGLNYLVSFAEATNGQLYFRGSQLGSLVIEDFAASQPVLGFEASFRMKIIPTSNPPAEGFSFNWATDLPDGPFPIAEEGAGSGLTVSFDTYDNVGGEAPAIDVKWNGVIVAHRNVPISLFVNAQEYADVQIRLHPDATIDVTYAGEPMYTRQSVPGAMALTGARFGIGARTGGLKATHTRDDLSLQLLLTPSTTTWQNITARRSAAPVNYHVDTNSPSARAFYRIFALP